MSDRYEHEIDGHSFVFAEGGVFSTGEALADGDLQYLSSLTDGATQ